MNLLNLLQSQLSPQTVGQISNVVGESPEGTKSAMSTAFPALLGSLVGKANASPQGATDLFNMVTQGQRQGGWSDSITGVMSSLMGGQGQAASQSLLTSLLGPKIGPVADFIASRCGIRSGSATSLLGMAAPLLMGTLGKQVSSQNLGASGLGQLLSSQAQYLKDALPSGLANTLGIGNLLSGTPERAAEPARRETYARGVESRYASTRSPGLLKWAWVPVLLALGALFLANRNRTATHVGAPAGSTYTITGSASRNPDLSTMRLTAGGVADNMAKAISAGDWGKTFELQGFSFDSAGSLTRSATSQVQEIASVLSRTRNAKAQLTGYGDTEDAALKQVNAIKNALTSAGVPAERISTRGQTGAGSPTITLMQ